MKDVNSILRKAYNTVLSTIEVDSVAIPVYAFQAPTDEQSNAYIVFGVANNQDASTASTADTKTTMNVKIYTFGNSSNSGRLSEKIANEVYAKLYAKKTSVLYLSADDCQMVSTNLVNDLQTEINVDGNRVYIDRIITFVHHIFITN